MYNKISMPTKANTLLRLALSVALALTGVYLLAINENAEGKRALAQGGSDYSATWQAKSVLVGRFLEAGSMNSPNTCTNPSYVSAGNPPNSEIAFGVATWEVKGTIDSVTRYKEVWSVPPAPDYYGYTGDWSGSRCNNVRTVPVGSREFQDNINNWLLGYIDAGGGSSRPAIQFSVRPADQSINNILNIGLSQGVSNLGKGSSCQSGINCFFSNGAYGFEIHHKINESQNAKHISTGILLPLKWTVTGFVCDSSTDNRCN